MNDEPSVREMAALWTTCMKFIEDQRIGTAETVYQSDRVIENAYEFIHQVCEIVGYLQQDEE